MAIPGTLTLGSREGMVLPADSLEPRWYAAHTCAHHEKRVRQHLEQKSVESFLPTYESVRRWKDRRMRLQLPLFPGYLFVRMAMADRLRVLRVPSVVRLVGLNGRPSALPDDDIAALREALVCGVRAEPHPFLTAGRRVHVKHGPFKGRQGILLRKKGNLRLVLSMDLIMRSVVVDVDRADVEQVPRS